MRHPWIDVPGVDIPEDIAAAIAPRQKFRVSLPPVATGQVSLWHATCTHRNYNLSCEQYEQLLIDSQFSCQRCGRRDDKLFIDHDHELGDWGVRGLLCPSCNSILGQVDNGRSPMDELTAAFLARQYPHRSPPQMAPVHSLYTLLSMHYQLAWSEATRQKWKFRHVRLMEEARIRRTRKFRDWQDKWERESGMDRVVALMEQVYAAHRATYLVDDTAVS